MWKPTSPPPKRVPPTSKPARLSLHATLAIAYFTLRGLDAQRQLLDFTIVVAYTKALQLTTNRYDQGVASLGQLSGPDATGDRTRPGDRRGRAAGTNPRHCNSDWATTRRVAARTVHYCAASGDSLYLCPQISWRTRPIASAEPRVAVANAQIGIAQSEAFYPTVTLKNAAVGLESTSLTNLFGPSALWSSALRWHKPCSTPVGAERSRSRRKPPMMRPWRPIARNPHGLPGRRRRPGNITHSRGGSPTTEPRRPDGRSGAAPGPQSLQGGVTTYLEVIIAQAAALPAETAIHLLTRRMAASVQLIQALAGDWWTSSPASRASELRSE